MKKFRKILSFVLALLMFAGAAKDLFPVSAAGDDIVKVKSTNYNTTGTTTGDINVQNSGYPDSSKFKITGGYIFKITSATSSGLDIEVHRVGDEANIENLHSTDPKKIEYSGAVFERKDKSAFEEGILTVSVEVIQVKDAYLTSAKIQRSDPSGSTASSLSREIKRNTDVDITLIVVDPSYEANPSLTAYEPKSGEDVSSASCYQYSNSFTDLTSTGNISIKVLGSGQSIGGKLTFEIKFTVLKYTGVGTTGDFVFDYVVGERSHTSNFSRTFPELVVYSAPPKDPDDEDEKDLDPLIPNIIVSSYDYGAYSVEAGQNFSLDMQFTNTSKTYELENVVMKIATGDGFSITNSSNSYFLEKLSAGESRAQSLTLQALPSAKAQGYPINIEFSFQFVANKTRKSGTSSQSISIPITQSDRFSVNELQVPSMVYVGEDFPLSLGLINKGKGEIYNVTVELRCPDLQNSGERQFVGNVASGTENSADFYISPQMGGSLSGELVVSYEDSNLNTKEVVRSFSMEVMDFYGEVDPGYEIDPSWVPEPEPEPSFWTVKNVGLAIGSLIVAGMTFYLSLLKIKIRRSEALDEDF